MGHHLKRLAVPDTWRIPKKGNKWIMKPSPGPHPIARSLPLGIALKDTLGLAQTSREVRRIVGNRDVLVDGKVQTDPKFPVSWMDVISVPKAKGQWRVLIDTRGYLTVVPIDEKEAAFKLSRIEGKTTLKGGLTQINLHDGRNLVVAKDRWHTGDVLKLELPSQKVLETIPFKEGTLAFITGGRHAGETATIVREDVKRITGPNQIVLKAGEAEFTTVKRYVFAVGAKRPEVQLPAPRRESPASSEARGPAKAPGAPVKAPRRPVEVMA